MERADELDNSLYAGISQPHNPDLRRQLTRHIALLLSLAGVAGAWMLLPGEASAHYVRVTPPSGGNWRSGAAR